jgi:tetratricopeptide (TPR) repeat protein
MRVEADFAARSAVSRRAAPIALACALAIAGLACPAYAAATAAGANAAPLAPAPRDRNARTEESDATLALEEQSLPPEDLASPAASPAAPSGSPSAGAADNHGAPGAQASPGQPAAQAPSQTPAKDAGGGGWSRVPAEAGGGSAAGGPGSAAESGTPAVGANVPVSGEPMPETTPTDAPPPYDVGSIQATTPVSDQPLTALIAGTRGQPALNASLRFAEQGRQALESSKPEDAIRVLGRAISIDPTDPYAYFYLGRAYMIKKDYAQALAFFGRSEVGLRTVPAWLGEVKGFEGACLEEQDKFPAAAAAYKQALDSAPGNLMARTGYGRLSESLSDANAGNATAPPPPLDGAAIPAPEVDLAAPAPSEAAPSTAEPDQSDSDGGSDANAEPGGDPDAASGKDPSADSSGGSGGQNQDSGAQGNQSVAQ